MMGLYRDGGTAAFSSCMLPRPAHAPRVRVLTLLRHPV